MTSRLSLVPPVVDPWTLDARAVLGATAVRFVEVAARNWMRLGRPEKAAQVLDVGLDYLTAAYGKTGWLAPTEATDVLDPAPAVCECEMGQGVCGVPATWLGIIPCTCTAYVCGKHKAGVERYVVRQGRAVCPDGHGPFDWAGFRWLTV